MTASPRRPSSDEQGDCVRFRARDVRVPPASELLDALWGENVLEGRVVARSRTDGGDCIVVQLEHGRLVVVDTACLLDD
jgi:hypothetical protein